MNSPLYGRSGAEFPDMNNETLVHEVISSWGSMHEQLEEHGEIYHGTPEFEEHIALRDRHFDARNELLSRLSQTKPDWESLKREVLGAVDDARVPELNSWLASPSKVEEAIIKAIDAWIAREGGI